MLSVIDQFLHNLLPFLVLLVAVVGFVWLVHWLLIARHNSLGSEKLFSRQLVMLALTLMAIVIVVLNLPINESSRNQLLALLGLLLSGIFAFSSTTVVANLFAGLLLRITQPFTVGNFIKVGDYFGRVVERGLFDTEVQSETRELISIPNTYLITHPIATTQRSGAIVSINLSLGYDIHHLQAERLLVDAAKQSGLDESFVHILELGDYSVTYRVSGMLADVKGLITARSKLYRFVLDVLHDHGIEVISPTFMSQRQVPQGQQIIPPPVVLSKTDTGTIAEEIVFDKAERAGQLAAEKKRLLVTIEELEVQLKDAEGDASEMIKLAIAKSQARLKELEMAVSELPNDSQEIAKGSD